MGMEITFPGGVAVSAHFDGFTVTTDQPGDHGGGGAAPTPFELFLASIGTCAGLFALRFCQERKIDTSGLRVTLDAPWDPETKRVARMAIQVRLPPGFPEKYRAAILRAVDQCSVKRHILAPPEFDIRAV
ncbi:MAG: OsmC family protein [Deferrisomatales bacterium]|nr:OsmC family protein [Deferrisomatales bacterium]